VNDQPDDIIEFEDHERARRLAGMAPTPAPGHADEPELTLLPPAPSRDIPVRPGPADAPEPPRPWYIRAWPWALVFLLALGLRIAYVQQIRSVPFFDAPIGDAAAYDAWAHRIAGGDWIGRETFYQAPAYPYFLAIVYRFIDDGPLAIRWIQAGLGAVACLLAGFAAARFFATRPHAAQHQNPPRKGGAGPSMPEAPSHPSANPKAAAPQHVARLIGITAGILLAVYPPAIFFGGLIQKTALATFWMTLTLWLCARQLDRPRPLGFLFIGIVLGLFGLTRENALVLAGVVLLWTIFGLRGAGWRARQMWITGLVAGLLLVFYPVAVRNFFVGGTWAVTTVQAGPNFYIGNNPDATGLYRPLVPNHETPEFERADARRLAEEAAGHELTDLEVSHYWLSRSWAFMRSDPRAWLELVGRKLLLTFNRYEIPDTEGYNVYCGFAWMLGALAPVLNLGTVGPLAAAGLVLTLARWRRLGLLYLMTLALVLAIAAFYLFARYRFPLVPLIILFAAAGIVELVCAFRDQRIARIAAAAAAVTVAAVACNWPLVDAARLDAMSYSNLGTVLAQRGDIDAAIRFFQIAIETDPSAPAPYYQIGTASLVQGDTQQAIAALMEAKRRAPAWPAVDYQLGVANEHDGNLRAAHRFYTAALQGNPEIAAAAQEALNRLGE